MNECRAEVSPKVWQAYIYQNFTNMSDTLLIFSNKAVTNIVILLTTQVN